MADYNSSLPVRTEADVDERLQSKLVDYTDPSKGATIDSDGNVHIEMHGNDPSGTDVVARLSELGAVNADGDYDVTNNSKPSSSGVIAHDRGAAIDETSQNKRVTAVAGEGDSVCMDVALHDGSGQLFDSANPFPVTLEQPGSEKHEFTETEAVAKDATATHTYSVADGNVFSLYKVLCSGSGKLKALLEIGDGGASEVFTSKAVTFNSTSNPQADIDFDGVPLRVTGTANTTTIRVTLTNRDTQAQDLHSTFVGLEV